MVHSRIQSFSLQPSAFSLRFGLQPSAFRIEARVIAENIFRLRIGRGHTFPTSHSWAVVERAWPTPEVKTARSRSSITLSTRRATLRLGLADGSWEFRDAAGIPTLSTVSHGCGFRKGHARVTLRLKPEDKIFGLGETTGPLDKRGLRREFWNIDVLGLASAIHPGLKSMYLSIPFGISFRGGRAAGLFWDNPHRQRWDLGETVLDEWAMEADGGEIDLYLFAGPTLADVVQGYIELTGHMPLPPRWALGYHQSRYSYETRERVEEIATAFRRKKIPCDALYLDIHHMDRYRVFTFGRGFPKPGEMLRKLTARGFKVVAIVDPGVKNDRRFPLFRRGLAAKAYVKAPGGRRDYIGKVWPGPSRFPDFTNRRVRAWWAEEQAIFQQNGLAGFWNDMNEPANFAGPGKTLPEGCRHQTDYGPRRHRQVHNVYGMQMARASREGARQFAPNTRPFIISRAGYAGLQRYAMVWTGDNSSNWEHLAESIPMLLNLGLSGLAFCGADVGGFLDSATGELLARWTQLAAFTPFFRNHANNESRAQEPWIFGREIEAICRRSIELRYRLLPYLYGLFRQSSLGGAPILRPLLWRDPQDAEASLIQDQFLLGDSLLVAPIVHPGGRARQVYLPAGKWFDFWTDEEFSGGRYVLASADLATVPLYVPAGAILPFGRVEPFVGAVPQEEIELHVWPGQHGSLDWYEDDATTFDYERGIYHQRRITLRSARGRAELNFAKAEGSYPTAVKRWRVLLHGGWRIKKVSVTGADLSSEPAMGRRAGFRLSNSSEHIRVTWGV